MLTPDEITGLLIVAAASVGYLLGFALAGNGLGLAFSIVAGGLASIVIMHKRGKP